MNGACLVVLFSRLNTGDLSRAYAELLRGFDRANNAAEIEQHAEDINELLWALKTRSVVTAEQAQLMDADLSDSVHAARQRLGVAP